MMGSAAMSIAIMNMIISAPNDQDCNYPMKHWVFVVWMLLGSKYLANRDREEITLWKLYCGKFMVNPFLFAWAIRGCVLMASAKGEGCYRHHAPSVVLMLIIVSFVNTLFFVIGTLMLFAFALQRIGYVIMVKFYGAERVDRMFLFRNNMMNMMLRQRLQPPVLTTIQFSELKEMAEKIVTVEELNNVRFMEDPCPICLEHFNLDDNYISLKCKHNFHSGCLGVWLEKKSNCPMCSDEVKLEDFNAPVPLAQGQALETSI